MADTTNTNTTPTGAPTNPSNRTDPGGTDLAVPGRRYRPRGAAVRDQRLTPRFTDAELSEIRAAADAAQMTLTGSCALAALAVARRTPGEIGGAGEAPAGVKELAELQGELFAARNAVNCTGVNLNQAVAALHSTGQAPVWLQHAVERVTRAVAEVDTVVSQIHLLDLACQITEDSGNDEIYINYNGAESTEVTTASQFLRGKPEPLSNGCFSAGREPCPFTTRTGRTPTTGWALGGSAKGRRGRASRWPSTTTTPPITQCVTRS